MRLHPRLNPGRLGAMDYELLERLLTALHTEGVEYVLVGGVAMSVHGLVRATEDIDLFVRPTEDNVARIRAALSSVWKDPCIEEIRYEDLAGEYPTIRYAPPGTEIVVVLLTRLGEAFHYDELEWIVTSLDNIPVRVTTPAQLHRMKVDTVRLVDKLDAARLREAFPAECGDAD